MNTPIIRGASEKTPALSSRPHRDERATCPDVIPCERAPEHFRVPLSTLAVILNEAPERFRVPLQLPMSF